MTGDDANGATTSFNGIGKWVDENNDPATSGPSEGNDYITAFLLRAPNGGDANYTFNGDSLRINTGGTLAWVGGGSNPSGSLTIDDLILNGGTVAVFGGNRTLTLIGNINVTADSNLNIGTGFNETWRDITLNSTITGGSLLRMNALNNLENVLTVNGNNSSFTGGFLLTGSDSTHVNSTLTIGHANALGTGTIEIEQGTLNLNGINATIGGLEGSNSTGSFIQNNSNTAATLTVSSAGVSSFDGVIRDGTGSGNLGLTQAGSGTLILAANNTFTGGVTINAGTLQINNAGALNSTAGSENAVTFGANSSGTLQLNGNSATIANLSTNATPGTAVVQNASATNATLTIGNSTNANGTFAGTIQDGAGGGTLALTKAGTGTLALSGTNTFSGGTNIQSGTLLFTNSASMPASGAVSVSDGATLAVRAGAASGEFTNATSGNGSIGGLLAGLGAQAGSTVSYSGNVTLGIDTTNAVGGIFAYSGSIDNVGTSLGLTKLGTGTLTLSGGGNMSGDVVVADGTLRIGADNGISTSAGLDVFGGAAASRVLDLNGFDQTLSLFSFTAVNSDGNLTITGGANSTLTINATENSLLGQSGTTENRIDPARTVEIDMSGLGGFVWDGGSDYYFEVGSRGSNRTGGTFNPGTSTVLLADNNTITASQIRVAPNGMNNHGGEAFLRLGQTNELNADTINIGASNRSFGTLDFRDGLSGTPTATIRGTDGVSAVGTWDVGRVAAINNTQEWTSTVDFSGGEVDALVTNLRLGRADTGGATSRSGKVTGSFSMGEGTLDVGTLIIGQYAGSGSLQTTDFYRGAGIFTLEHADGLVKAQTIILADNIGTATNGPTRAATSGTFSLDAGTLEAITISGGADTGNAAAANITRNFNFTSGTVRNIAGGDLLIDNIDINLTGSGSRVFEATAGQSITIGEDAVISGIDQGFTKTGNGTLILAATNTFSGDTIVEAGTLLITGSLGSSAVTVENNATIGGSGTLGNGLTIEAGGKLDLHGATIDLNSTDILTITGGTLTLGNFTFQDIVGWDWQNAGPGTYELIVGSFSIDWGSTAYLDADSAYDFGNGLSGYFTSGSLNVVIIPEPGTAGLVALFGLGLMARRRRA